MDWTWFLFGFEGRISRAKFWLAALVWFASVFSFMTIFLFAVAGILRASGHDFHSVSTRTMHPAFYLLGVPLLVIGVWCFVELFCLRGIRGPNRFGPDPLVPAAPVTPAETRPRWDQQSELEFVPYSAGPSPGEHVMRGHD